MKTTIKLLAILTLLIYSCSKDDEQPNNNSDNVNTPLKIEANQSEIIKISYSGELNKEQYDAFIGDSSYTVYKENDSTLVLSTPNILEGNYEFSVPDLNYKNEIKIIETILSETPEILLTNIESAIADFNSDIENEDSEKEIVNSVNSTFSEIIKTASDEEKKQLALFYEANKLIFDDLLYNDFKNSNSQLKVSSKLLSGKCLFCTSDNFKFKISVLTIGGGALLAKYGGTPLEKAFGVAALTVGFVKAKKFGLKVTNKRLKLINSIINSVPLIGGKVLSAKQSILSFSNKQSKKLTLSTENRFLNNTDRNSINEGFVTFFSSYDKLNDIVETINSIITFVNDKIPFSTIKSLSSFNLPTSTSSESFEVESSFYDNFNFNIANDKVSISTDLVKTGEIEITLTADESVDLSQPIETQLIINYKDDFNDLTKEFDIVLENNNPLFGKWIELSFLNNTEERSTPCTRKGSLTFSNNEVISIEYSGDEVPSSDPNPSCDCSFKEFTQSYTVNNNILNAGIIGTYNFVLDQNNNKLILNGTNSAGEPLKITYEKEKINEI